MRPYEAVLHNTGCVLWYSTAEDRETAEDHRQAGLDSIGATNEPDKHHLHPIPHPSGSLFQSPVSSRHLYSYVLQTNARLVGGEVAVTVQTGRGCGRI